MMLTRFPPAGLSSAQQAEVEEMRLCLLGWWCADALTRCVVVGEVM